MRYLWYAFRRLQIEIIRSILSEATLYIWERGCFQSQNFVPFRIWGCLENLVKCSSSWNCCIVQGRPLCPMDTGQFHESWEFLWAQFVELWTCIESFEFTHGLQEIKPRRFNESMPSSMCGSPRLQRKRLMPTRIQVCLQANGRHAMYQGTVNTDQLVQNIVELVT